MIVSKDLRLIQANPHFINEKTKQGKKILKNTYIQVH